MREIAIFYKQRIEECKELARHSSTGADKEFWAQAAQRWTALLQRYEKPSSPKSADSRANTRRMTAARKAAA